MKGSDDIIEGNKLIVEFMGCTIKGDLALYKWLQPNTVTLGQLVSKLQYHSSWDWLMPVVEKVETIQDRNDGLAIIRHSAIFNGGLFINCSAETKIEAVWLAVVEFIKRYNNIKT